MAKCTFCSRGIEKGTGTIFVDKAGTRMDFCSSKCEKNHFKLRRKPRKTEWTISYQKAKREAEQESREGKRG